MTSPAFQLMTPPFARKRSENAVPLCPRPAPSLASGRKFVCAVMFVPVIAPAAAPPIVTPSIVPPLMSAVETVPRLVQVAPAAVGEPVIVTPEMVGEVPKTSAPEPVSSPTIPMSSDDASIDVVPSAVELIEEPFSAIWYPAVSAFCFALNVLQSAAERRPRTVVAPA